MGAVVQVDMWPSYTCRWVCGRVTLQHTHRSMDKLQPDKWRKGERKREERNERSRSAGCCRVCAVVIANKDVHYCRTYEMFAQEEENTWYLC